MNEAGHRCGEASWLLAKAVVSGRAQNMHLATRYVREDQAEDVEPDWVQGSRRIVQAPYNEGGDFEFAFSYPAMRFLPSFFQVLEVGASHFRQFAKRTVSAARPTHLV